MQNGKAQVGKGGKNAGEGHSCRESPKFPRSQGAARQRKTNHAKGNSQDFSQGLIERTGCDATCCVLQSKASLPVNVALDSSARTLYLEGLKKERFMTISDAAQRLKPKKLLLATALLAGAVLSMGVSLARPLEYRTSSTFLVIQEQRFSDPYAQARSAEYLAGLLSQIVDSDAFRSSVFARSPQTPP